MKMKKLVIINNYQGDIPVYRKNSLVLAFNELKWLKYEFISYTDLKSKEIYENILKSDGLILSGSRLNLSEFEDQKKMEDVLRLIKEFDKLLLGICFGHHLIGHLFGFKIDFMEYIDSETDRIISLDFNPSLFGFNTLNVHENHKQEIKYAKSLEEIFDIYASSEDCKVQAIKHKNRPIYGVQFHPETAREEAKKLGIEFLQKFASLM
jgi:GMP synthase (glutamine-hydrolysing)